MQTYNMHYAKTHLSKLVEAASKGEGFIIARAGKPLVRVEPVAAATEADATGIPEKKPFAAHRFGGMAGRMTVPDDIKTPFKEYIEELFYGDPEEAV